MALMALAQASGYLRSEFSSRRKRASAVFGGLVKRRRGAARRTPRVGIGSVEPLEPRVLLASDLMITEFMASNDTGINDADDDTSDWIEVHNETKSSVDLTGWYLTDDPNDLTKWQFPSKVLAAGESLVVFASGKNRTDASTELHTNFQLSRGGEFLAIVQPDGQTISDEYAPYPTQYPDVSFGPQQEDVATEYVAVGADARVLLPGSAADDVAAATWTAVGFDDGAWQPIKLGAGYDTDPADGDFSPLIDGGGDLSAMQGQASSAYVRASFNIDGDAVPDFNRMTLTMNHDDGFVAYLNGTEVTRRQAPETLAWDSVATDQWGGILEERQYTDFLGDEDQFVLAGDASWLFGRLQLTGNQENQTGGAWTAQPISFGSDYSFSTFMAIDVYSAAGTRDSDGRGGEGMTFVLQSESDRLLGSGGGGLGMENTGAAFISVEFDTFDDEDEPRGLYDDGPELPTHVGVNTSAEGSLGRVAVERFNGGSVGQNVRYAWIDYNGVTDEMQVYFSDTNAKPEIATMRVDVDLEELFGDSPSLYAGWTAATSEATNTHNVVQWEFTSGAGELGLSADEIDISEHLDLLTPGENVLAVHGLNLSANDGDFLVFPRLSASETLTTDRVYFSQPTPGEKNGPGGAPPAEAVTFSVPTGVFVDPFMVEIASAAPDAVIHYTTDGSVPTETSPVYTGPIEVTESTRIRARAVQEGRDPGTIATAGYTQLDDSLTTFENDQPFDSNLPLMIFDSNRGRADSNDYYLAPVTATFISPGEDGRASILDTPDFTGIAGLRIRGQSSQGWAKKQYALEIWEPGPWEDHVELEGRVEASEAVDKSISIFGLPSESDWVLNGPYSDKTQLNNYLAFQWSNEMGLYAPRTRMVEVFVNDNGGELDMQRDYRGTYILMEKIKLDKNRVNITPMTRADNSEPEITGGYIWKKDKDGRNDVNIRSTRNSALKLVEPDWDEYTDAQLQWLTDYIAEFENALYGPNFTDPDEGYAQYVDVDSWIDTWILVEMTKQIDGYRLSTYYYKDRGGKIHQGPPWDYNLSLNNANYLKGAYPEGWYKDAGLSTDQYPYWDRLFEDPSFYQALVDRWQDLRQTLFTTENMLADIDAAVNLISDGNPNYESPAEGEPSNPIARNVARWGSRYFTTYQWPNCFFGVDDCPRSPLLDAGDSDGQPDSYADYIYLMKNFVERRLAWMDSQFMAYPTFSPESGNVAEQTQVTLTADRGTIVYTTNGTDPRDYVAGTLDTVLLPAESQADILVPTVLDPFANTLVQTCTGTLANPDACMMSPNYTLGTHGESWISGPLPAGFDNRTNFTDVIKTDLQSTMDNLNQAAYFRIPFEVAPGQADGLETMALEMRYEDGFVAYLWSDELNLPVEIARYNAPGDPQTAPITPLPVNASATRSHSTRLALEFEKFDVTDAIPYLHEGTNYLFLQGLNQAISSHDFLIDAQLSGKLKLTELPEGVYSYSETGPITLDRNMVLVARAFDVGAETWSGAATASYVVSPPNLAITELNYNPYPPTADEVNAGFTNSDDFEFVEIQNVGTDSTDLIGTRFNNGITYTFPSVVLEPGERAVIVRDLDAFQTRYGTDIPVLGTYADNLGNDGEKLTVVSAVGDPLLDFVYDDSAIWPQSADGVGATLQLVDAAVTPTEQFGKYYRWRGSTEYGGSPGTAAAAPMGIVVNEVLSSPAANESDAIELVNTSSSPVDVSGWYLSDNPADLMKYRLPDGTVIGPGQYLVVSGADFDSADADASGFGLSGTAGDDVWLVVPDGEGGVASLVDDVHFGSAIEGESWGRVPNGSGRLAPMTRTTLGGENAAPRVGPVVISEVNYYPSAPSAEALAIAPSMTDGDLEFVEIHNPTSAAVDLQNWRLRGGVDIDFDMSTPLDPGESLVVISFNPAKADNADRLSAFRAHYGLGDNVKIVGGYGGQLSNNSERVSLLRPGLPTPTDPPVVPRYLEDEVVYDDLPPWPASADGQGSTLTRTDLVGWGNAPESWTGAQPTPGSLQDFVPLPGDANMDRQFDERDIVLVLQAGKYLTGEPATFSEGDWNGDGVFDNLDLVAALQVGHYLQGPYAAATKVRFTTSQGGGDAWDADAVDEALNDDLLIDGLSV